MTFKLRFPEIKQDRLIKFSGENGPFYVCTAGGKPELENCFFYGDDRYQFFFYARWVTVPNDRHDIEIYTASVARLRGPPPRIEDEYIGYIEINIHKLFIERRFHFIQTRQTPEEQPRKILFTWNLFTWKLS